MRRVCQVFRSSKKEEMYLYVDKAQGLVDVPEALMTRFGEPQAVMTLLLDPERKLSRANASEVLKQIAELGYYLQMPPTAAELLRRDGENA